MRRDGSGGDEGESVRKVNYGKGMVAVGSAGVADGAALLHSVVVSPVSEEAVEQVLGAECARSYMGRVQLVILPCPVNRVLREDDDENEGTGRLSYNVW